MRTIATFDLAKYYGDIRALDGVDLEIYKNEIFTILGPNGAGKTTFLLLLSTVLKPSRGTAYIKDFEIRRDAKKIREIIGIAFQEPQVYWRSRVIDTLRFHASIFGIEGREREERISRVLRILQLDHLANRRLINLSGGQVKKVEVAKIFVQRPEVAFFDEPTAMVDLDGKHAIWEEIKRLRDEGSTVIVATNEIYEAEILSDRVVIFDRGKVVVVGGVSELKERLPSGELVELKVREKLHESLIRDIESFFKPTHLVYEDRYIAIRLPQAKKRVAEIAKLLIDRGVTIESINVSEPTLDDVFLHYTRRKISGSIGQ